MAGRYVGAAGLASRYVGANPAGRYVGSADQAAWDALSGSATATVADFSQDQMPFDSGAAAGTNSADIPLSGTTDASDGAQIEARVVRADNGAAVQGWTAVATAAGGAWSGSYAGAQRSVHWLKPEVRVQGSPETATTANRFGVGHILAIWGQSEWHQWIQDAMAELGNAEPLVDEDMMQIVYRKQFAEDGAAPSDFFHEVITDANPISRHVVAMANTLAAIRPGEKFAMVFHTRSGTSFAALGDDTNDARNWADEKAMHDFITDNGATKVGTGFMSWHSAPAGLGDKYDDYLFALLFGTRFDGRPLDPGPVEPVTGKPVDHDLSEFYDWTHTRMVLSGPHRFDFKGMDSQFKQDDGTNLFQAINLGKVRRSLRRMVANPVADGALLWGADLTNYRNGEDDGAGGVTDIIHPSQEDEDGMPLLARMTAHCIAQAIGWESWEVPVFNNWTIAGDGSYIEAWFTDSQGVEHSITTTRKLNGETPPATTQTHQTDVFGFEINNTPLRNTAIVDGNGDPATAGRVRIYPNSGTFGSAGVYSYRKGGGGVLEADDDIPYGLYKDEPIVDYGLARSGVDTGERVLPLYGAPVRPDPRAHEIPNTLATETAPDVPADLAAAPDDREITLTWTAPSDGGDNLGIAHYRVEFSEDGGATWTEVPSPDFLTATTLTHYALTNGQTYTYRLRAENRFGASAYTATLDAVPAVPPPLDDQLAALVADPAAWVPRDGDVFTHDGGDPPTITLEEGGARPRAHIDLMDVLDPVEHQGATVTVTLQHTNASTPAIRATKGLQTNNDVGGANKLGPGTADGGSPETVALSFDWTQDGTGNPHRYVFIQGLDATTTVSDVAVSVALP